MLIPTENDQVALIAVFEVDREKQQELLLAWNAFSRQAQNEPGFKGATLHKSTDGTRVLSCAQWASTEDWERFVAHHGHEFARFTPLSIRIDPHLYELVEKF
ncbi:MAG TPA: antibiotic biosynthesis monooxygenase family protein [Ktedonobacteraceae bacterium]|nr:antibiotic biosynthesis monooxygenase family protein [Ktedonobacteraceae bacterium]